MKYFSIYDKKAETFSLLSPAVNEEVYIRGLTSALLTNPDSPFVNYPEDFEIYLIGEFLEAKGFFCDVVKEIECPIFVSDMNCVVSRLRNLIGRSDSDGENVQE